MVTLINSCSEDEMIDYYNIFNLPEDQGIAHTANRLGATDAPYGYYVYTPSCYDNLNCAVFPVLIFLLGSGEKGDSESRL
jgi:hypothetical protein